MEIALLVISLLSLFLNVTMIIISVVMVRALSGLVEKMGEHDSTVVAANSGVRNLTKELLMRLPARPYGTTEREPDLMMGPADQRIPR